MCKSGSTTRASGLILGSLTCGLLGQRKGVRLSEVCNYKALESYNYLQSGWVGKVLTHKVNDEVVILKGSVTPSQAVSSISSCVGIGETVWRDPACMLYMHGWTS